MNETRRISVAMCTFNGGRFLAEQLESIANQSVLPFELVVCDDGSTDDTLEILQRFRDQVDFPVRIIQNAIRVGSSRNFERAIRKCRGRFIALADQDDSWCPDKVKRISQVMDSTGVAGVFTNGLVIDEDSREIGHSLWGGHNYEVIWGEDAERASPKMIETLLRRTIVTGATLAFRTELCEALIPVPVPWVHDAWIAWMLTLKFTLRALNEPLIRYRIHSGQQLGITGSSISQRFRRALRVRSTGQAVIAEQYEALYRYIRDNGTAVPSGFYRELNAKCKLSKFRSTLPQSRMVRTMQVMARVGAYRRFENGWQSILKDLLT